MICSKQNNFQNHKTPHRIEIIYVVCSHGHMNNRQSTSQKQSVGGTICTWVNAWRSTVLVESAAQKDSCLLLRHLKEITSSFSRLTLH